MVFCPDLTQWNNNDCTAVVANMLQMLKLHILLWPGLHSVQHYTQNGSETITIKSSTDCATLSRMNWSGYVEDFSVFSYMFTIACCLAVGLGLGLGLGLDLVSGWLVVTYTYLCDFWLPLSHCDSKRECSCKNNVIIKPSWWHICSNNYSIDRTTSKLKQQGIFNRIVRTADACFRRTLSLAFGAESRRHKIWNFNPRTNLLSRLRQSIQKWYTFCTPKSLRPSKAIMALTKLGLRACCNHRPGCNVLSTSISQFHEHTFAADFPTITTVWLH